MKNTKKPGIKTQDSLFLRREYLSARRGYSKEKVGEVEESW